MQLSPIIYLIIRLFQQPKHSPVTLFKKEIDKWYKMYLKEELPEIMQTNLLRQQDADLKHADKY